MVHVFTVAAGAPIAEVAARHILDTLAQGERPRAVVFVPTRRAVVTLREAFQRVLGGEASLLPQLLPLADIEEAMLTLLGPAAVPLLEAVPPAMPEWQQRYLLTAQVRAFLARRQGETTLDYALALAEELMALQEQCARSGVTLTHNALAGLVSADMAEHWKDALAFLDILAEHWPRLEQEMGMVTAATREVRLMELLAAHWREAPPQMPVFALGSTASQEATAALLEAIARAPRGAVILPGLDGRMADADWQRIAAGHPLYHLKQWALRLNLTLADIPMLAAPRRSIWLDALADAEVIPAWAEAPLADYAYLRLLPCAHAESEARTISLLMREALEMGLARTALVTPDEGLMARVAAHMKRYGVEVDRLTKGTLATTDDGSMWMLLLAAMREPERLIHLRSLLHHPLIEVERGFLDLLELYWYGVAPRRVGQLPKLPEPLRMHEAYPRLERLVRELARHGRLQFTASQWVEACRVLLSPWAVQAPAEAVAETLEQLGDADILGPMELTEFARLLEERFAQPVRHGGVATHPQLVMLTPVEARLQRFDRVIIASMTDAVWPGMPQGNAWLNLAAQEAIGLPPPMHHASLMAHDVLMLASQQQVFLTWSQREQGSPAARSRFIERLVTLLAMHGVPEGDILAHGYEAWAEDVFAAEKFAPHAPVCPMPPAAQRPRELPVSALDALFSDPFSIYARYVLGLKELEPIDAEPEASDFGSLAHKAIQALTLHWNHTGRTANAQELASIADTALRDFADRPSAALFWRARLLRALGFVNDEEAARRTNAMQVDTEMPVRRELPLGEGAAITLHGRIDRVEPGGSGVVLADYKTGDVPGVRQILEGQATQLLAYAMLFEHAPQAIEYWRLPHGRHKGEVVRVAVEALLGAQLPEKLRAALRCMQDAQTPFLANPNRFTDVYNGISRYEEWAG